MACIRRLAVTTGRELSLRLTLILTYGSLHGSSFHFFAISLRFWRVFSDAGLGGARFCTLVFVLMRRPQFVVMDPLSVCCHSLPIQAPSHVNPDDWLNPHLVALNRFSRQHYPWPLARPARQSSMSNSLGA